MTNKRSEWVCTIILSALLGCSGAGSAHSVGALGGEAGVHGNSSAGSGAASSTGSSAGSGANSSADSGSGGTARELDASLPDGSPADAALPAPFDGEGVPWMQPVPRATCGAGDVPETGIQGLGVNVSCNVNVIGSVAVHQFISMAWSKTCAYVNDTNSTAVIDVSNDAKPTVVKTLTTTGMQNNWESMKVGATGLLVGYQANGAVLDIYDVSADCKNPTLKKSFNLGGLGHSGNFSTDGTIYYASSLYTSTVYAVDLMDPANPKTITSTFTDGKGGAIGSHDLNTAKGGNRAYFTYTHVAQMSGGSLGIVDTSQIQARQPNARGTLIKEYDWGDGSTTQYPIPVTYRGKDYLIVTDELGSGNCNDASKPPYGYARILDISDEMNPTLVSLVKTQAEDPAYCQDATKQAGTAFPAFGVGTHYCNVDRIDDPRLLACAQFSGGVRVYDIRNPWRPTELAYLQTGSGDQVGSMVRILPDKHELWVQTGSKFYVLKFPDSVIDPIINPTPTRMAQ